LYDVIEHENIIMSESHYIYNGEFGEIIVVVWDAS